jgi:anti-sigma regulatory factor (Ser/Thr protein kinase)
VTLRLGRGPEASATARRALRRLRSDLDPPLVECMRLLVTELITNAVRHTRSPVVRLSVAVADPVVRVEVQDSGAGFVPQPRDEWRDREGGWGLVLVDRLADRWGVAREAAGTRVWLELDRRV